MNPKLYDRIALAVAASGAVLVLIAYALFGFDAAVGAFAGASVAALNFLLIRWVTARAAQGGISKGAFNALMVFKTMGLMAACWILVVRMGLDSKGFMIGITALVIGIVAGPLLTPPETNQKTDRPDEPDVGEPEVY